MVDSKDRKDSNVYRILLTYSKSLKHLANRMGCTNIDADYENYWEWVECDFFDHIINISRTHTIKRNKATITILLMPPHSILTVSIASQIIQSILNSGIKEVCVGKGVCGDGDEYEYNERVYFKDNSDKEFGDLEFFMRPKKITELHNDNLFTFKQFLSFGILIFMLFAYFMYR